ncbi:hypothetical protein [Streptomyces sp. NPDC090445]|uniref:hypothetical protein n=1 Tax=Streptomyces sp. NPDC090445 TaxID=3365963 RepID=UPI00380CF0FB
MLGTRFRSEDVPAGERLERWRELIDRTRATDATTDHAEDFRAELHRMELGPVTVWWTSFPPVCLRRTARSVRRADSDRSRARAGMREKADAEMDSLPVLARSAIALSVLGGWVVPGG